MTRQGVEFSQWLRHISSPPHRSSDGLSRVSDSRCSLFQSSVSFAPRSAGPLVLGKILKGLVSGSMAMLKDTQKPCFGLNDSHLPFSQRRNPNQRAVTLHIQNRHEFSLLSWSQDPFSSLILWMILFCFTGILVKYCYLWSYPCPHSSAIPSHGNSYRVTCSQFYSDPFHF